MTLQDVVSLHSRHDPLFIALNNICPITIPPSPCSAVHLYYLVRDIIQCFLRPLLFLVRSVIISFAKQSFLIACRINIKRPSLSHSKHRCFLLLLSLESHRLLPEELLPICLKSSLCIWGRFDYHTGGFLFQNILMQNRNPIYLSSPLRLWENFPEFTTMKVDLYYRTSFSRTTSRSRQNTFSSVSELSSIYAHTGGLILQTC